VLRTVDLGQFGLIDLETTLEGQLIITIIKHVLNGEQINKIKFDKAETFLKLSEPMEASCNKKVQILTDDISDWINVKSIIVKNRTHTEKQYLVYTYDFMWDEEQGKSFMFTEAQYEEIREIAEEMSKIKRINL